MESWMTPLIAILSDRVAQFDFRSLSHACTRWASALSLCAGAVHSIPRMLLETMRRALTRRIPKREEFLRYTDRQTLRNQEWESEGEICRVIRKLILVAEGAVSGVVCAGGYFLTPTACFQWASLNTGVYWPVGLYFPKAGATELYSLYRLCVITEQRQEGCSALNQHNPTSNPHFNHVLPPSEKERLTERGMDGCRPEAKIHRSEFFSPRPNEYGTGVKFPSCSPEWMDEW